jgi:hypothetical protein
MLLPTQSKFDNQPGKYIEKINPLLLQGRSVLLPSIYQNTPG